MSRGIPLFRFDTGWPFVVAGLALLVSALLIPAQRELHDLKGLVQYHRAREQQAFERLAAYDRFLQDLSASDDRVLRRLAASQLNLKLAGAESLMLASSMNDTVVEWIDASVPLEVAAAVPAPDTLLSRLATGPRRLWILGIGTFLMFIGLFVGPETEFSGRKRKVSEAPPSRPLNAALPTCSLELKDSASESIPSLEEVEPSMQAEAGCSMAPTLVVAMDDAHDEADDEADDDAKMTEAESTNASEQTTSIAEVAECDGSDHAAWVSASPQLRELRVALDNENDPRSHS